MGALIALAVLLGLGVAAASGGKDRARAPEAGKPLPERTTPPTQQEIEDAHQEALALVDEALEQCPEEEARLLSALDAFALEASRDPERALSTLDATIDAICKGGPLPPEDASSAPPAQRAGEILAAAHALCPNRSADIDAISFRFGSAVLFDAVDALRKLEQEMALVCPAALEAPSAEGPPGEFPAPEDVAGDLGVPATPEGLAEAVAKEARRVGCENVSPELIGAFQQAATAAGIPNLSPPDGLYDFLTAAAVARFVENAPPPCRFGSPPGASPAAIDENAARWSDILENLGAKSPGWPEVGS